MLFTVTAPPNVLVPLPSVDKLLYVKAGMVCAAPLKLIVLPVIVFVAALGVNVQAIPIVPDEASVTGLVLLIVKL